MRAFKSILEIQSIKLRFVRPLHLINIIFQIYSRDSLQILVIFPALVLTITFKSILEIRG